MSTPKSTSLPLLHGRETYAVYYGTDYVLKRPLPTLSDDARSKWLSKQHKTQDIIDAIRAVSNPIYNIPRMLYINDDEYQILEERAQGEPLTQELFCTLSKRQQYEIQLSLASFVVDMNESRPIGNEQTHQIREELKFSRLNKFITTKMQNWFDSEETKYMVHICDEIESFEYTTRLAWSHGDLNSGNVYYDKDASKLFIIDFAEAGYKFIYRDIFAPLHIELDICNQIYETYKDLHNNQLYTMPGLRNDGLRDIMKYRMIIALLRRFIKASDDLRINPQSEKSALNNVSKVSFMRAQITKIQSIESQFTK